jgi:hypothetical protein
MKKKSFLFVAGFLALSLNCFSQQLFINSSGYVGVNQLVPAYNLDWLGNGRFWAVPGWGALIFDNSTMGVATMHPNEDWTGALGTSTKRFNHIYTYVLHYDELQDWSDARLKENIKPLANNLDKIKLLRGVSYNMKKEFYNISDQEILAKATKDNKTDFGFLAQEIKEVFPEVVSLDSSTNYYSVNYVKLIPVLIEAVKEQQVQIEELKKQINK